MPSPIAQLLSRTEYAGDGVTTSWEFSFSGGYLDRGHVKAYTETATGFRTQLTIMPGDFIGDYTLNLGVVPVDTNLLIYRDTPKDLPLVDFVDGGRVTEASLDLIAKQAVFIAAETVDTVNALDVAAAVDAAASAAISAVAANASAVAAAAAGAVATAAIAADLAAAIGAIASDRAAATGAISVDRVAAQNAIAVDRAAAVAATGVNVIAAQAARDAAIAASFVNTNPTGIQSINGGQLAGFRNRVINGGCQVRQRSPTILTATPTYGTVDQYLASCNGSGLSGQVQEISSAAYLATGYGVGILGSWTSGAPQIETRIEAANTFDLNNQTITVSGVMVHSIGSTRNMQVRLNRPTTTPDVFSAQTVIATSPTFSAASGAAVPFSFTVTLGASDATNGLAIQVYDTAPSTVSSKVFSIGEVQLERGTVATQFERRPYGLELALCQRYLQPLEGGYAGFANGSTVAEVALTFPVPMRASPTIVATTNPHPIAMASGTVFPSSPSFTATSATNYGITFRINNFTGLVSGQALVGLTTYTNYGYFSAEL